MELGLGFTNGNPRLRNRTGFACGFWKSSEHRWAEVPTGKLFHYGYSMSPKSFNFIGSVE